MSYIVYVKINKAIINLSDIQIMENMQARMIKALIKHGVRTSCLPPVQKKNESEYTLTW